MALPASSVPRVLERFCTPSPLPVVGKSVGFLQHFSETCVSDTLTGPSMRTEDSGYCYHLFFKVFCFNLCIFIFGCVGSLLLRSGFLCCSSRGLLSSCGALASPCGGFLLRWFLLVQRVGLGHAGFSSCGIWA